MPTLKGHFKPSFPEKYIGNKENIVYRSGWELKFMSFLDKSTQITRWASEEFSVCYFDPTSDKIRRYFPDFMIEVEKDKIKKIMVIEIKPKSQTVPPQKSSNKRRYLKETYEFARNISKWKAARKWCEERGYEFKIMTEDDLFGPGTK